MKGRAHDPARLDVAAFAAQGARLGGNWAGAELPRLAASQALPQDATAEAAAWQVAGERRAVAGGDAEFWLRIEARTEVWLTCQRCLQPMRLALEVDRRIQFVRGEAQAEALDAEAEHDVLALTRALDLRELIEDELLLALPLVPRHDICPQPLSWPAAGIEETESGRPFDTLAELRSRQRSD